MQANKLLMLLFGVFFTTMGVTLHQVGMSVVLSIALCTVGVAIKAYCFIPFFGKN
ncbi:uncharacterized membrane protein YccF (DUF307 family) [Flammeovirga yaeyamensis]|nr:uncharacterized membrane protein YccF (DUF307 family) [Flammeovirga yaeyamensis]